jgi:electron-transferring-flavoprotein dehydrogenase
MAAAEREQVSADALFVGAGPASLAGALRLARLVAGYNEGRIPSPVAGAERRPLEAQIVVIEKARQVGQHGISGAVLNPAVLAALVPDFEARGFPAGMRIEEDRFLYLTPRFCLEVPPALVPRANRNRGFYTVSLGRLCAWLAALCEEAGVQIFPDTTGVALEVEDGAVRGVVTGDKGVGPGGAPRDNFQPGAVIESPLTILGEGPRGTLAEDLIQRFGLASPNGPQIYSLGVKELVRLPEPRARRGMVLHTMGHPIPDQVFGGGFIYSLEPDLMAIGVVAGLAWRDPAFDLQERLQRLKAHPRIYDLLRGGEVVAYGAKAIPEGGYWALPRPFAPGALLTGDSAGFVNIRQLKGIHYAMQSGILAAEAAFEALVARDFSAERLSGYQRRLERSFVHRDLFRDRNFRRAFDGSFRLGLIRSQVWALLGGGPRRPPRLRPDHSRLLPAASGAAGGGRAAPRAGPAPSAADPLFIDKLSAVHRSGTLHREDQPSHIRILEPRRCVDECIPRYGTAPCTHFCPARVYELVGEGEARRIQINFSNCVHCKTCVILDPLDVHPGDGIQNIDWRAPAEGGPRYNSL